MTGVQTCALPIYNTLPIKHIWVPHSLGLVKKRNVPPDQWQVLRIEERIQAEKEIIEKEDEDIYNKKEREEQMEEEDFLWDVHCILDVLTLVLQK